MLIPKDVLYIIEQLNKKDYGAFIVGGCVRDSIMGKEPKDWDITTAALPNQVKQIFKNTYDTGIEHGTVTVVLNHCNYEITTYRIDGEYLAYRRPERVFFTENLEQDLMRRDFTINAIAYHNKLGFVDPFDGMADIKNRIIRGVGAPKARFQEDALRILRAIRFSAQLGFQIEPETWAAILKCNHLIQNISAERIRDELNKILLSDSPEKLGLIIDSGVNAYLYPAFSEHLQKNLPRPGLSLCKKDLALRLTLLMQEIDIKKLIDILRFYKVDNKTIKTVECLIKWFDYKLQDDFYQIRRVLSELPPELFSDLIYLKSIKAQAGNSPEELSILSSIEEKLQIIINEGHCFSLSQLRLNGNMLKDMGVKQGARIGFILNKLLEHVLKNPEENTEDMLKALAGELISG